MWQKYLSWPLKAGKYFGGSAERTINSIKISSEQNNPEEIWIARQVLYYYQIKIDFHFNGMTEPKQWFSSFN